MVVCVVVQVVLLYADDTPLHTYSDYNSSGLQNNEV